MWRYIVGGLFLAIIAAEVPAMLDEATKERREQSAAKSNVEKQQVARIEDNSDSEDTGESYNPLAGRTAKIKSDRRGHFVVDARLNGRRAEVLVDTGATSVALNKSMARRIGIRLTSADFKYSVSTANGRARAASAYIDEVEIGRIRVKNVRAMVMEDRALDTVLLGMTFLNELKKFEVSNGTLLLAQ